METVHGTETVVNAEGISLQAILEKAGASVQVRKSKAVAILENALTDGELSASQTARDLLNALTYKVQMAEQTQARLTSDVQHDARELDRLERRIAEIDSSTAQQVIEDRNLKDGLVVYGRMLATTREVFGEDSMTEQVICKAIEAASYGMWRSVMGPKDGNAGRRV